MYCTKKKKKNWENMEKVTSVRCDKQSPLLHLVELDKNIARNH